MHARAIFAISPLVTKVLAAVLNANIKERCVEKNPFWRSVSEKWVALLQTFSFGYLNFIAVKCAEPPQFKFYQEPDFSCVDDKNDAFPHSHCCSRLFHLYLFEGSCNLARYFGALQKLFKNLWLCEMVLFGVLESI